MFLEEVVVCCLTGMPALFKKNKERLPCITWGDAAGSASLGEKVLSGMWLQSMHGISEAIRRFQALRETKSCSTEF